MAIHTITKGVSIAIVGINNCGSENNDRLIKLVIVYF
jgi:hypothetical protein